MDRDSAAREGAKAPLTSTVWALRRSDGVEFRREVRVRFVDSKGENAEGMVIGFAIGNRSDEHALVVRRDGERFHEYAHPSAAELLTADAADAHQSPPGS